MEIDAMFNAAAIGQNTDNIAKMTTLVMGLSEPFRVSLLVFFKQVLSLVGKAVSPGQSIGLAE